MPEMLAFVGPAMSAAGALGGLFGGKKGTPMGVNLPPYYQLPGMDQAAGGALAGIPALDQYNVYGQTLPQFQALSQYLQSQPYGQQAMGAAQGAAGLGTSAAQNMYNTGSTVAGYGDQLAGTYAPYAFGAGINMMDAGRSLYPYMSPLLQMGFDPQNALHDRMQHDLLEQTRTGQAARGIETSPYGAGLESKALSDFNIDWQNQLLNRALSGAQGAAGLGQAGTGMISSGVSALGQGGNFLTGAGNLQNLGSQMQGNAAPLMMQSGMYPYSMQQQMVKDQFSGLTQAGQAGQQAAVTPEQMIANYLSYLGIGNQANQVANQRGTLGLTQQANQFGQQQTLGNNLGQSIYGLTNAFRNFNPFSGGATNAAPPLPVAA